jgi:superfamily II DNA or RNA helicase
MRPPAVEKMGYYPTHDNVAQIIQSYIAPAQEKARLLDPCCGEGKAAAILGQALNCETWGAELSYARAEMAAKVMDKVHKAPWEACWMSEESVSLLFLNPPYETDRVEHQGRHELTFLKSTTSRLVRGGLLIYIIPQHILGMVEIARQLAGHYENFTIGRYPDSVYGQVIIFALRSLRFHLPESEEVAAIQAWAKADIPDLEPASEAKYTLLPAPSRSVNGKPVLFKRNDWTEEEMVEAAAQIGVMNTTAWKDLLNPRRAEGQLLRPVMPLKKGHIAMLMASGMMGTVRLADPEGSPMLIKGRVVKIQEVTHTEEKDGVTIETVKDRFVTSVAVAKQSGLQVIKDVKGLTEFMQAHGDQIAAHVLDTYRPLYNMDPTVQEKAILDILGKTRKPLPGQEPGLLTTQRHAAAAMARTIRVNGVGNLQGEMGLGKTIVGASITALLDAFPSIVLCPPTLVNKWIREIEETIPGAKARELRRIGRNSQDPADVNDVQDFLDDFDAGRLGTKAVAVVANTSAKMGPGWEPALVMRNIYDPLTGQRVFACCCPLCGSPVWDDDGMFVTDFHDLPSRRLFCQGKISGWEVDKDEIRKLDGDGNPVWGMRTCGNPLFVFNQARRYSIAEYISKQCKGRFKLLICDEVHQMKGKGSDRGVAFHQLVTACKWTLTLTGTFFGGKSTSIFWLLHRLNHGVRRDFGFNEEMRWARLYGVLEDKRKAKKDDCDDDDGVFTGNRRYRNTAKEQPGISPAIINRLLDTTVFLSLKDLGIKMPDYKESVVTLDFLKGDHLEQYKQMDSDLKDLAKQDGRYLSVWLQWALARPNSAFRDEVVITEEVEDEKKKIVRKVEIMQLPAVIAEDKQLPKEDWLANFCLSERKQGRKVLVYLRQTGTRDIQARIQSALEKVGLRTTILTGSVDTRKREEWIARRVDGMDVLVCNPKLVETGLDLIAFSSVVFYEIEYSLYTLWQAVRRVWRLGQEKAVKAVFSVYSHAMEAAALSLMGKKMKAAQLLYGDEVGGAIVPEDDGDFLTQLARDVLAGARLSDLATLFAEETQVSHNPLGSMTAPSAVMVIPLSTWEDWLHQRGAALPVRRKQRAAQALPAGQTSLF